MQTPLTLDQIRDAAAILAAANRNLEHVAREQENAIRDAIAPIVVQRRSLLDLAAKRRADAEETLITMLNAAPQLFQKPRSLTMDGVKCGYQKGADSLEISDDSAVIARIRALMPDKANLLIRTEESLVMDGLAQLNEGQLRQLGVSTCKGVDGVFVKISESDVDKLAKAIIADASKRRGDEGAAKLVRRSKKAA